MGMPCTLTFLLILLFFVCLFLILALPFMLDVYVFGMREQRLNSSYVGL